MTALVQAPLTPWLPGDEMPAREGVYRRQFPAGPFSCWDGERWMADANTADSAARQELVSRYQHQPWRGLAAASGEPCATCRGHGLVDQGVDVETGADLITECVDC